MKRKDPNRYPPGLDVKKARDIIKFYDNQSEKMLSLKSRKDWRSKSETMWLAWNQLYPSEFVIWRERRE